MDPTYYVTMFLMQMLFFYLICRFIYPKFFAHLNLSLIKLL